MWLLFLVSTKRTGVIQEKVGYCALFFNILWIYSPGAFFKDAVKVSLSSHKKESLLQVLCWSAQHCMYPFLVPRFFSPLSFFEERDLILRCAYYQTRGERKKGSATNVGHLWPCVSLCCSSFLKSGMTPNKKSDKWPQAEEEEEEEENRRNDDIIKLEKQLRSDDDVIFLKTLRNGSTIVQGAK